MVLNTPVLKQLNSSLRIQHVINYGGEKKKKTSREFQAGVYDFSQKAAAGRVALECLPPDWKGCYVKSGQLTYVQQRRFILGIMGMMAESSASLAMELLIITGSCWSWRQGNTELGNSRMLRGWNGSWGLSSPNSPHHGQVAKGLSNTALRTSRAGASTNFPGQPENMKEKNDQPPVFWFS